MSEVIHIYHTNDLHSHFANWPKIKALLKERRRWHEEEGDACLVLDIGDHVDRSHPFTEGTAGKGNVEMLNEAVYDAVTIGNNEGITLSKEELNDLYVQADFDVIVGNLFDQKGDRPEWAKPYQIIKTTGGTRIGLVGATADFTPFYKRLGWQLTDGKEAVLQAVEEIKDRTDLIICLSHLGIKEDEYLAELCPDIDVLLGAHTHHIFQKGKEIGKTLLGAAGKFGYYIGHITIDLADQSKTAYLIETANLHAIDDSYNDSLLEQGKQQMNDIVFYNEEPLRAEWFGHSQLAELFGQSLMELMKADCALFNAGIFVEGMPQGEVTSYDFHRMLPHPINPCLVELSGAELKEIYLQSLNEDWPHLELKGMGFRGVIFGKIVHINLKMVDRRLYIGDQLLIHDKIYRLATLDLFTFGYFFPSLKRAKKTYFMPEFLRDVFSDFFHSKALK
ncbi:bifunctional metallophosphatase/5'-nucleotidase [Planococcus salinus]|uniref:Bifunctional metallophosphatase/5'-nucleotidase n=1 Tax=Planococcus salinus TaxID=1848460 RepID=A0A3M8P6I4_9BACL|nr:bifunctional UDP-sugar hydrolase/5'-nucleotidase [Planococcus salinus]RNF39303.1 bifunctional metallophosphatase/5'-nucleotidase [Planococcus salinus]